MNMPLPAARSPRSRLSIVNGGKRILPTGTPMVNAATVPNTAIPITITRSCFSPVRKSSWRPAPARLASLGSSVPCTAWKRRGGMRATKKADVNAATAAVSPGPFNMFTPSSEE